MYRLENHNYDFIFTFLASRERSEKKENNFFSLPSLKGFVCTCMWGKRDEGRDLRIGIFSSTACHQILSLSLSRAVLDLAFPARFTL